MYDENFHKNIAISLGRRIYSQFIVDKIINVKPLVSTENNLELDNKSVKIMKKIKTKWRNIADP